MGRGENLETKKYLIDKIYSTNQRYRSQGYGCILDIYKRNTMGLSETEESKQVFKY
jgi:hypothetical protein